MNYQEKLIRKLAKKRNMDFRVVREIVYSPLKFTNRIVKHNTDMRPIRIMYFAAFTQKVKKNKINRLMGIVDTLLENIDEVAVAMYADSIEEIEKTIKNARDEKDYDRVKEIFDAWQEYIK